MRIYLSVFLVLLSLTAGAQQNIGELFKSMPDSLMPLLTTNNRLDMIDFMDAKMKARVVNKLEGESEMTILTADTIVVKISSCQTTRLFLQKTPVAYDSCQQVICMENDYHFTASDQSETVARYFSVRWRPLDEKLFTSQRRKSSILKQDEQVFQTKPVM